MVAEDYMKELWRHSWDHCADREGEKRKGKGHCEGCRIPESWFALGHLAPDNPLLPDTSPFIHFFHSFTHSLISFQGVNNKAKRKK